MIVIEHSSAANRIQAMIVIKHSSAKKQNTGYDCYGANRIQVMIVMKHSSAANRIQAMIVMEQTEYRL